MLDLPNEDPRFEDLDQLCDWLEISVLLSRSGQVSKGDADDVLGDSLLFDSVSKKRRKKRDDDDDDADDQRQQRIEDLWRCLHRRSRALGQGYPFVVGKHDVTRRGSSWRDSLCFSLLVIADLGKAYKGIGVDFEPGSNFCRLFEKVVEASQRLLFRGTTVRFGWPLDPVWPKPIERRVTRLADQFSLPTERLAGKLKGHDKDIGLDVASRLALGDEDAGLITILTQCATGANWLSKHEPSVDLWKTFVQWHSVVIRAIAFPWRRRKDEFFWRQCIEMQALVLDRMRLLSAGNPDVHLDAAVVSEIEHWCEDRLKEFPQVGA